MTSKHAHTVYLPGNDLPGNNLPGNNLPGNNLPGNNLPANTKNCGLQAEVSARITDNAHVICNNVANTDLSPNRKYTIIHSYEVNTR